MKIQDMFRASKRTEPETGEQEQLDRADPTRAPGAPLPPWPEWPVIREHGDRQPQGRSYKSNRSA